MPVILLFNELFTTVTKIINSMSSFSAQQTRFYTSVLKRSERQKEYSWNVTGHGRFWLLMELQMKWRLSSLLTVPLKCTNRYLIHQRQSRNKMMEVLVWAGFRTVCKSQNETMSSVAGPTCQSTLVYCSSPGNVNNEEF